MIIINARQAALSAIGRCRRDGAWSAAVMDSIIKSSDMDKRDAAFASRLVLSVLQNEALCDFYIAAYCRSAANIEPRLRDILRLGCCQLLFFDRVPARAAVNETVALCKLSGYERASGLVNAVLRRVVDNLNSLPDIPGVGTAEHLSVKYSHPQWLVERLIARRGYGAAEAFLACDNRPSGMDIQVNTLKISTEDYTALLREQGTEYSLHQFLPGCLQLTGGSVAALPGFEAGCFYVQDVAARAAAYISGAAPGMRVLDACSAPGGKSFAAAIMMHNEGSILSCDIHAKKLRLVEQGAERLGIDIISTRALDARCFDEKLEAAFDLVIADVPCSGLGVIGKKPEIRHKKPEELSALPAIQLAILCNLSRYVKPGGTLIYSTCTILEEENEAVVRAFLNESRDFTALPFTIGSVCAEDGMYTFWPDIDAADGFFAARLIRK